VIAWATFLAFCSLTPCNSGNPFSGVCGDRRYKCCSALGTGRRRVRLGVMSYIYTSACHRKHVLKRPPPLECCQKSRPSVTSTVKMNSKKVRVQDSITLARKGPNYISFTKSPTEHTRSPSQNGVTTPIFNKCMFMIRKSSRGAYLHLWR
jgi:hypothetical protein